jgi:enoyl-CoA hydratase/carnithine racemase
MSDVIQTEREGRLLRVILNRPEKRNALNAQLCRDLIEALDHAARDRSIGAVLLTANGPAFCAGMDITEMIDGSNPNQINALHEQLFTLYARLDTPVVCAIEGAALGGGAGLVANCHVAVASPRATFGLTEIRLGLWPFLIFRAISAAMGERRAIELSLTGRIFPSPEARELGLIHEIADDAPARALKIARALSESSPSAIHAGLNYIQQVRGMSWDRAGEVARMVRDDIFASDDFAEGIRAFVEKRQPRWPSIRSVPRTGS